MKLWIEQGTWQRLLWKIWAEILKQCNVGQAASWHTWASLQTFAASCSSCLELRSKLRFFLVQAQLFMHISQPWADWINSALPQKGSCASTFPFPHLLKSNSLYLGALALPLLFTGSGLVLGKPALCFSCSWEVPRFYSADSHLPSHT